MVSDMVMCVRASVCVGDDGCLNRIAHRSVSTRKKQREDSRVFPEFVCDDAGLLQANTQLGGNPQSRPAEGLKHALTGGNGEIISPAPLDVPVPLATA